MLIKVFFGLILILSSAQLTAQEEATDQDKDRQYVTDQLRLSLYQEANERSRVIKLLQSGDVLEIEQLSGAYALVTTSDGSHGWVKRGFLVTKPTSNLLLEQEQGKTRALEAEIEKLSNSKVVIDQYEKDMNSLMEKMDTLEVEKQKAAQEIAELRQEIEARQLELERKDDDNAPAMLVLWDIFIRYWQFIAPIILVIVLLSFLVSKEIVESRIRRKFHGIKIW